MYNVVSVSKTIKNTVNTLATSQLIIRLQCVCKCIRYIDPTRTQVRLFCVNKAPYLSKGRISPENMSFSISLSTLVLKPVT